MQPLRPKAPGRDIYSHGDDHPTGRSSSTHGNYHMDRFWKCDLVHGRIEYQPSASSWSLYRNLYDLA